MMNNNDIKKFFKRQEIKCSPCPLTDALINGGYKQKSGGYIETAKKEGIENPTQYWHLIECWSKNSESNEIFNKRIQCGELLFWMAEVSKAVEVEELEKLKDNILSSYRDNRREGNRKIQEVCFDKIVDIVTKYSRENH